MGTREGVVARTSLQTNDDGMDSIATSEVPGYCPYRAGEDRSDAGQILSLLLRSANEDPQGFPGVSNVVQPAPVMSFIRTTRLFPVSAT